MYLDTGRAYTGMSAKQLNELNWELLVAKLNLISNVIGLAGVGPRHAWHDKKKDHLKLLGLMLSPRGDMAVDFKCKLGAFRTAVARRENLLSCKDVTNRQKVTLITKLLEATALWTAGDWNQSQWQMRALR